MNYNWQILLTPPMNIVYGFSSLKHFPESKFQYNLRDILCVGSPVLAGGGGGPQRRESRLVRTTETRRPAPAPAPRRASNLRRSARPPRNTDTQRIFLHAT